MCGIVGYVGHRQAVELLVEGLHRLEYRGYDSAGIAIQQDGEIIVRKKAGQVAEMARLVDTAPPTGTVGIGHTRWATHGEANDENPHPHIGGNGSVCLVHNGVIENYEILRDRLQELGYVFHTATDSEVVAHLVAHHLDEQVKLGEDPAEIATCVKAVEVSLQELKGTYGLGLLFRECPDLLIAVRVGSPLVVGIGKGEYFIASDASPLMGYTDQVVYLDDNETAVLTSTGMELNHRDSGRRDPTIRTLDQVSTDADFGDYPHYMLKEIYEQPQALENALRGRIDDDEATARFGGLNLEQQQLRRIDRIVLTACGTSWHAGLVGEYLLEEFARIPTPSR
jgi:glucosamine--fructose-6-phosphate aminotransferase (isomerizing)